MQVLPLEESEKWQDTRISRVCAGQSSSFFWPLRHFRGGPASVISYPSDISGAEAKEDTGGWSIFLQVFFLNLCAGNCSTSTINSNLAKTSPVFLFFPVEYLDWSEVSDCPQECLCKYFRPVSSCLERLLVGTG